MLSVRILFNKRGKYQIYKKKREPEGSPIRLGLAFNLEAEHGTDMYSRPLPRRR